MFCQWRGGGGRELGRASPQGSGAARHRPRGNVRWSGEGRLRFARCCFGGPDEKHIDELVAQRNWGVVVDRPGWLREVRTAGKAVSWHVCSCLETIIDELSKKGPSVQRSNPALSV